MFDVQKHLLPGEEVVYKAHYHPFIFLEKIIYIGVGFWFMSLDSMFWYYLGLVWTVLSCIGLLRVIMMVVGTHQYITNRRIIFKTGIFTREIFELKLENCETIHYSQPMLGRIFRYGNLKLNTGGGTYKYRYIYDPFRIKKIIYDQLELKRQSGSL